MMRVALLVLALLAIPLASLAVAQEVPAGTLRVLEDPEGDEDVTVAGQHSGQTRWAANDLRALDVSETATALHMVLTLRDLGSETTPADSISYEVRFTADDAPYGLRLYYSGEDGSADGSFCAPDPDFGDFLFCTDPLVVTADPNAETLSTDIPFGLLVPAAGGRLLKGDLVHSFQARAENLAGSVVAAYSSGAVDSSDAMPDTGLGTVPYMVQSGPVQTGHILASSVRPVRVSNGEATTMVFEVNLRNTLDRHDTVVLAAEGAPSAWVVTFPEEELRLDAGDDVVAPVLVTTPFNHQHGAYLAFNVTATSRSDPLAVGRVELAVRYTTVPQPAGHHNTLFLHGVGAQMYVNTLEAEEIPAGETSDDPVFSGGCSSGSSAGNAMTELVPLIPQLQMGLDVDLAATGLAHFQFASQVPVVDGYSIGGFVQAWRGNERPNTCQTSPNEATIMVIERSAPFSIEAGGTTVVETAITPMPAGDYLPYEDGLNFALLLVLWQEGPVHPPICCLGEEAPTFAPGSTFRLPLAEYHDAVDQYFSTLSGIELYSSNEQQRLVNPGETAVFTLTAENIGTTDGSFDLELTGTHTEWARILGDGRITLGAGASRELAVAVAVPDGAFSGETADITLHAVKSDDTNVRSLIRLLATVDDSVDHPDDSDQVDALDKDLTGADAPGLPWMAVLAGLALAAAVRRRRA